MIGKALKNFAKLTKTGASPQTFDAMSSIGASMNQLDGLVVRQGIGGNTKYVGDVSAQNMKNIAKFDVQDLPDVDYENFNTLSFQTNEALRSTKADKLTLSGVVKSVSDEEAGFRAGIEDINASLRKSTSGKGVAGKLFSSAKRSIENKDKSALGLSADNPARKYIDDLVSGKKADFSNNSILDSMAGIPGKQQRIGAILEDLDGNMDKFIYDGDGDVDGAVQRFAKKMNLNGSPESDLVGVYNKAIRGSYGENLVALAPDEINILSTSVAIKDMQAWMGWIDQAIEISPDITKRRYRNDMNLGSLREEMGGIEKNLQKKLDAHVERAAIKTEVKVHNGKNYDLLRSEGHFKVNKKTGDLPSAGKYFLGQESHAANNVFIMHIKAGRKMPMALEAKAWQVEKFASSVAKAMYIDIANGKKLTGFDDLVARHKGTDAAFSVFDDDDIADFLRPRIDRAVKSEAFGKKLVSYIDSEDFLVMDLDDARKMVVQDHGLPKAQNQKIANNVAKYNTNYEMSNRGHLMKKTNFIDNLDGMKPFDANDIVGRAIKSDKTDAAFSKNASLLAKDGWIENTAKKITRVVPMLDAMFSAANPLEAASVYEKIRKGLNQVQAFYDDLIRRDADSSLGKKYKTEKIGMLRDKRLPENKDEAIAMKVIYKIADTQYADLKSRGVFSKDHKLNYSRRIVRDQKNAIPEKTYKLTQGLIEDSLRKNKGDINKTKKEVLNHLLTTEKMKTADALVVMEDITDPIGSLGAMLGELTVMQHQVAVLSNLKKKGALRTTKAPGWVKIDDKTFNKQIISEMLGTSSGYVLEADYREMQGLFKVFEPIMHETFANTAKTAGLTMNSAVRHNLLSNNFATRIVQEIGNLILSFNVGLSVFEMGSLRKKMRVMRKNNDPIYQEMLASGLLGSSVDIAGIGKSSRKLMDQGKMTTHNAPGDLNPLDPNSAVSQKIMHHSLGSADLEHKMMIIYKMRSTGHDYDEIAKVIRNSYGRAEDVPGLVSKYSEIPGGDLFARYTYTMGINLAKMMTKNPRRFLKTSLAIAAVQQTTTHAFLTKEERRQMKKTGQKWMKPSFFGSIIQDPSFAMPGGKYMAVKYMSPFDLSVNHPYDSINPVSQAVRALYEGKTTEKVMRENVKGYRKFRQFWQEAKNGEVTDGAIKLFGGTIRQVRPKQRKPSQWVDVKKDAMKAHRTY